MTARLICGDAAAELALLPAESVQCCVTSPPYFGLRDYGVAGQLGLEPTPDEYVAGMVAVMREVRRVLRRDGTLWLNLGDSYAGSGKGPPGNFQSAAGCLGGGAKTYGAKQKDLLGIPWMLAFALRADGWYLRSDIIWHKPNPMPESVRDRPTRSHEYLFLLAKSKSYYYDHAAVAEPAVSTHASGNAYKRPERLTFADDVGARGSDEPWSPSYTRPQQRRARELAAQGGLTEAHFAAIRAVGASDAGQAKLLQGGAGKNAAATQALADEAKAVLGGYYREFLIGATRNRRDVWTINTKPFPGAHFATFPEKLVEPCVLAGSSERGECGECGSPWERIIAKEHPPASVFTKRNAPTDELVYSGSRVGGEMKGHGGALQAWLNAHPAQTTGWRPTCQHSSEPVPQTVLDPFSGAATVSVVAARLGRSSIGIDLSPAYTAMAAERLRRSGIEPDCAADDSVPAAA